MSAPTPDDPYADALSQALSTGKVVIEGAGVQAVVDFTGATPTAEHAETAENDAPFCNGSMRSPQRTTDVNGATWGVCRACGRYEPLNLAGSVKPHRTRPIPPGSGDAEQGQS